MSEVGCNPGVQRARGRGVTYDGHGWGIVAAAGLDADVTVLKTSLAIIIERDRTCYEPRQCRYGRYRGACQWR